MKSKVKITGLIVWLFLSVTAFAQPSADALRCELLTNPLGIDKMNPRLSWQIQADARNVVQTAYHILVASSPEKLAQNIGDLWDSGKTESDNSIAVFYDGKALKSDTEVFWKVKVYTNKGASDWSVPASWRVGLLYYKDWNRRWIGFDGYFDSDDKEAGYLSARYFRKEISITKEVQEATAYIMGLGLYELYIDGHKVGDQVLAPGLTDYTKNVKYNVFDVTELLNGEKHTLGVILGNGRYYAIRQEKPYKVKNFGFPKMQMQIRITYTDGSRQTIHTDDTWKGTTDGPIISNNEYDGEIYDARKELKDWAKVGYDDATWERAEYVQEPGGNYEAQINNNMKVMQDLKPVSITPKEGKYIIDFGQNFSGWVKMRVQGPGGTEVTLRFAESLNEDGTLFRDNLRAAKATDVYILKGGDIEEWEPRFTYHGFRYVEVEGYPGEVELDKFIGRLVYDEMETVGSFTSSNALLNQIHKNAWWGIASNYKSIPVDCPQRNERQAWLGDRPGSAYGENFLFDNANFYSKWLEDIRLSQKEDGAIPDVAPAFWRYYSDNMTWPGTYLIVADMLYQQTGDVRILEKHYPAMKKWMRYMEALYRDSEGIITKDSYGDWCAPPATIEEGRGKSADVKRPNPLISTAYYYHLLQMIARFSEHTGNSQDRAGFEESAANMKKDFNKRFYNPSGYYGNNTLTENLLAMYFGLVEEGQKEKLADRIVEIIEKENNGHLSTGLVGTQWIMRTLTDMGRADLAYKLATNTTYPSWGYMLENGATTIWELWNGDTAHPRMNSQNHVMMLGDLLVWYYENLAGIKSAANGFQRIIMKPELINGLDDVEANHKSIQGMITSSWKRKRDRFAWQIAIPANTTAHVYIPAKGVRFITEQGKQIADHSDIKIIGEENGRVIIELGSGKYQFLSTLP
ncbi:alpha-L-rhamnosidase [Sphingobacterium chuzhouense]|uniref:alpha-L-rhamnosidase n=1 Tax=Sphingobacterium chuzhouense TaxID=1742264 RepID=A0ABR7XN00_9SPHI|nr:alpha-L-rhamnosidase [Sphingobacterium chuzhouense]MBD1420553.1 family 78 glycoside hydrolase catalytic domain [Sphingobacterium chuzhouense]